MRYYTFAIAIELTLIHCVSSSARADAPFFVALNHVPGGGSSTVPWDASANGSVVVGKSVLASGYQAFRWTNSGGMMGLSDLPGGGSFSEALGVSADGAVIVGQSDSAFGREAFRWQGGAMIGLGDLPGSNFSSLASDTSADGSMVVGHSNSNITPGGGEEAFRWENGLMTGLGSLGTGYSSRAAGVSADGSVIVGSSDSPQGLQAFRSFTYKTTEPSAQPTSQGLGDGRSTQAWRQPSQRS